MTELKTKKNDASVEEFLASISDEQQRKDSEAVCQMMEKAIGEPPKMWGSSIVGFGSQHLKYASGRELDWMIIGFSPRKANLTLYVLGYDVSGEEKTLLSKLGKHSTGVSCLYIKRLADIDLGVLRQLVDLSIKRAKTINQS